MLCWAPCRVFPAQLSLGFGLHVVIQYQSPMRLRIASQPCCRKITRSSIHTQRNTEFHNIPSSGHVLMTLHRLLIHTFFITEYANTLTLSRNYRANVAVHVRRFSATCLKFLIRFHMLCDKLHKHSPPQFIALWTLWVQRTIRTKHCFSIVCDSVGCSAQRPSP